MTLRKRTLSWLLPAVFFFAVGFVVSARWDLPINIALYSPNNLMAKLFEAFGWLPVYLPAILLAMLWVAEGRAGPQQRWRLPVGLVLLLAGGGALCYACYHYLEKRALVGGGPANPRGWLWMALAFLAFGFALWWVLRQGEAMRHRLFFFAHTGCVFMLLNVGLTSVLKTIWQRPRFDEMLAVGGFAAFRPWYMPLGAGGASFPSAHTAGACGVFLLLVLCDIFPRWNRHRGFVTVVCWGYISLMALSRILLGRHFLSDTLAAMALVALLFFAIRRSKWYQQGLLHARAAGPVPRKEG